MDTTSSGRMPVRRSTWIMAATCDPVRRIDRDEVVNDQAELAKLGHVTRARLTQIMAFLNLVPDIQEVILTMPTPEVAATW